MFLILYFLYVFVIEYFGESFNTDLTFDGGKDSPETTGIACCWKNLLMPMLKSYFCNNKDEIIKQEHDKIYCKKTATQD